MGNTVSLFSGANPLEYGRQLSERLNQLPPGKENCQLYQSLGIEIFDYLFRPDLTRPWSPEQSIDRRLPYGKTDTKPDAMYAISLSRQSTWTNLGNMFGSKIVTVDFKNLSTPPEREQVVDIGKYLNPRYKKTIAILCTRQAPSASAISAQNSAYMDESEKLILMLFDGDIFEMLRMKRNRKNPVKHLERQIDDILARIGPS